MKRILVLGSTPHSRDVVAYAWGSIPPDLYVPDFDVVILNLVPLADPNFSILCDQKDFPASLDFARLIFSTDSELIVIGSPHRVEVRPAIEGSGAQTTLNLAWCLPVQPQFQFASGNEIRKIDSSFNWYIDHVKEWSFWAEDHFQDHTYMQEWFRQIGFPRANVIRSGIVPIAQTRFGCGVAFRIAYQLKHQLPSSSSVFGRPGKRRQEEVIFDSGYIFWLPPPTEITDYEAVNLILAKRFKVALEQEPPAWIGRYNLPRQSEVQSRINDLRLQEQNISTQLEAANADLKNESYYFQLIFEQGDHLENIVWSVLEELGATVERPIDRGKHDGRLVDPKGRHAVLEIKGRKGEIGLKDVRQCDQWNRDAITETDQAFKGILIGNARCATPLEERNDWFASNAVSAAERFGLILIKSSALFRAIQDLQSGNFDQDAFWDIVFSANGICDLPDVAFTPTSEDTT